MQFTTAMPDQVQETVTAAPKKSRMPIYILLGVVVLGAAGGGGFLWFRHHKNAPAPEKPKVSTVIHLETFVVNLADEDQHTFLKVGIDLGVAGGESKAKEGEAATPISPIRDAILSVLMATHSTDLATMEGRQKLKEQLLQKLRQQVPGLPVEEVYFTEYLLQR